jgi:hypothetical protein
MDYTNPKNLIDYAIWYYDKYSPSIDKLKDKLFEKSLDRNTVELAIKSIEVFLREEIILESHIDNLLLKGKNEYFIMNKMLGKKFHKQDIARFLEEKRETENRFDDRIIVSRIELNLPKKSINDIKTNLLKSGFQKVLVERIIEEN